MQTNSFFFNMGRDGLEGAQCKVEDLRVGLSHFVTKCKSRSCMCVQVSQAEHPTVVPIQGKHLCALLYHRDTLHFVVCQQYVTLNSAVVILRKFTPSSRVCTEMLFSTNYLHKQHLMLHERSQTPAVVRMSFAPDSKHGSEHVQICIHT